MNDFADKQRAEFIHSVTPQTPQRAEFIHSVTPQTPQREFAAFFWGGMSTILIVCIVIRVLP